jgi:hypothetical protein
MSDVGAPRYLARVALATACSALALGSTGCLITSTPQFKPQEHTAPFLVASSAFPDTRDVVKVDYGQPDALTLKLPFTADVISQDDPLGSGGLFTSVYSALYIDYGVQTASGQPFLWDIQNLTSLPPGTLDQTTPRKVEQDWFPGMNMVTLGCHTATLVVSHMFDPAVHCPVCADDSSSLTWQVLACNSQTQMGSCDSLPIMGSTACPIQLNPGGGSTCASVEMDAGVSVCPSATDAGAP